CKHRAPFGGVHDPEAGVSIGPPAGDVGAVEEHLPTSRHDESRTHAGDRRLACAVGAEQREHASDRNRERHPEQGAERSVPRIDVAELEQGGRRGVGNGRHQTRSPRYALRTALSANTDCVSPDAMSVPKSSTKTRSTKLRTKSTSCSTNRMAMPRSWCTVSSVRASSAVSSRSSPDDGSSSRSSFGPVMSAR